MAARVSAEVVTCGDAPLCGRCVGSVVAALEVAGIRRLRGLGPADELAELHRLGAVCDTLGLFFDACGQAINHPVSRRSLAVDFQRLIGRDVVLLGAGIEKVAAMAALLRTGVARGLVIDGDAARLLAAQC